MRKLYIIGNGFDLHHKLPTSYASFHRYVLENQEELANEMDEFFEFKVNRDSLWSDFENDLGTYDYTLFFDKYNELDPTDDSFERSDIYGLEDEINESVEILIEQIRDAFSGWVASVEYPSSDIYQSAFLRLDRTSKFISFNYTGTLEDLYNIPVHEILYIHNKSTEENGDVVFGHARSSETNPKQAELDEHGDSARTPFTDAEDAARFAFYAFQKDTDAVLQEHESFFTELCETEEIIVLGHSLGEVDWPYFRRIAEITPGAIWKFSYYLEEERETLRKKVKQMLSISEKNFTLITIMDLCNPI